MGSCSSQPSAPSHYVAADAPPNAATTSLRTDNAQPNNNNNNANADTNTNTTAPTGASTTAQPSPSSGASSTVSGGGAAPGSAPGFGGGSPPPKPPARRVLATADSTTKTTSSSSTVVPVALPMSPTILSVSPGNGQATVTLAPPRNVVGLPVSLYTVTSNPGAIKSTSPTTTVVVNGLENGQAYSFVAQSTNALGTGVASVVSAPVTPVGPPGKPTIISATAGFTSVTIAFSPPASNGGYAITSYTVISSPGGLFASGTGSPITVSGLIPGQSYTFTVSATNAIGTGVPSNPSLPVIPVGPPSPPTITSVTPLNGKVAVAFAVGGNGGLPISSFSVTSDPQGIVATGTASPIVVPGLTNGTAYTFVATASNSAGTSGPSIRSPSVTPVGPPSPPSITGVVTGNATATVSFSPPLNNGGLPVSSYMLVSSPDNKSIVGGTSPLTLGGLTNGTAYTFTVSASNLIGSSGPSAPSAPATPLGPPSAPVITSAAAGDKIATISFNPPLTNGGTAITNYTVVSMPGGISATGLSSPIIVPGLTCGQPYTFTVSATNAVGTGPPSSPSQSIVPVGVPSPPTITTVTPSNGSALVSFIPGSTGGLPISKYSVISDPQGIVVNGASSPIMVTGLTNGMPYTFVVTATNSAGTSTQSVRSVAVTPVGPPGAPVIIAAEGGDSKAIISFAPPANNGGLPITAYTATSTPEGRTATGATSPLTIPGLTNGTSYTFTVTATNSLGTGPSSSPSFAVVPTGPPGAPTITSAVAGDSSVTVSFTAPLSNGGSPITSYTVVSDPDSFYAQGTSSPLTVTGLTNGKAYVFYVFASNIIGTGAASLGSASVTPQGTPQAPSINSVSPRDGAVLVDFTPGLDGGSPITGFTVTSYPDNITTSSNTSPILVSGLTNGTVYTFDVTASNVRGTSAPSARSLSTTPFGVPFPPSITSVSAGDASAVVAFNAGSSNGSPITSFTVVSSPGGVTVSGTTSPLTVTGLSNGTSYTFTAIATNAAGNSGSSAPSSAVTPSSGTVLPPISTAGFILLAWSRKFNSYIDVATGYIFVTAGTERNPLTNATASVNSTATVVRLPTDACVFSFDPTNGSYTSYNDTLIDPSALTEQLRSGDYVDWSYGPRLLLVTSELKVVDFAEDQTATRSPTTFQVISYDNYDPLMTPEIFRQGAQP